MTGEEALHILMSNCDVEEEFIESDVLPPTKTKAERKPTAGLPDKEESVTVHHKAPSGKEIEESGLEIDNAVDNLCDILRIFAENTRATLNELRKEIAAIESIVKNKDISYIGSGLDAGKKEKAAMKLLVEEYEGRRGEAEKEFILSGIYLFHILPKQVQIMRGLKKAVKMHPLSFSGMDGSSLQQLSGIRKDEEVEYTTKVKEADVPTIGGYPGRAILNASQRKKQAENLLAADMRKDTQLFTTENIIRLLEKGPVALDTGGFKDGMEGGEMELGDIDKIFNIAESNGNGDTTVCSQNPEKLVDGESEEEYDDDEETF